MTNSSAVDPRYPIGDFVSPTATALADIDGWIRDIAACPTRLRESVAALTEAQLNTPYREGGWTIRQVVHHVPDSHVNAYVRTRLALTETDPVIKPYAEADWAALKDARKMPVDVSLDLLEALHRRWVNLLESLGVADFERAYVHPEMGRVTLGVQMALYSWHSRHHVAHITALRARRGW
jgi:hypothetical protein